MSPSTKTYGVRLAIHDGGKVKAELTSVGQTGEKALHTIARSAQETSSELEDFGGSVSHLEGRLKHLGRLAAGLAIGSGVVSQVRQTVQEMEELSKASRALGITTEALQGLQYAAQSVGADTKNLSSSLETFVERIGEANLKSKDATAIFASLGVPLKATDHSLRSTEDILKDVADSFQHIQDPVKQAKAAIQLFGEEGAALIPLLSQGSKGIAALEEKAQSLGIVFDRDMIAQTLEAKRAFEALGQTLSTTLTRAFVDISPLLTDLAKGLQEVARYAGIAYDVMKAPFQGEKAIRTSTAKSIQGYYGWMVKKYQGSGNGAVPSSTQRGLNYWTDVANRKQIEDNKKRQEKIPFSIKQLAAEIKHKQKRSVSTSRQGDADVKLLAHLKREQAALHESGEKGHFINQTLERLSANATKEQRQEVKALAEALYDEKQALRQKHEALREGKTLTEHLQTGSEKYAATLEKLNTLLKHGAISQDTYTRAQKEAYTTLLKGSSEWQDGISRALNNYVTEAGNAASQFEQITKTALKSTEDAFVNWAKTGKFHARDLFQSIADEALRAGTRMAVMKPIGNMLQSFMGNFSSSLGGSLLGKFPMAHSGGVIGKDSFKTRELDSSLFHNAPRFHRGGIVGGEVPILAQRGEVIFTPHQMKALGSQLHPSHSKPEVKVFVNINNKAEGVRVKAESTPLEDGHMRLDIMVETIEGYLSRRVNHGEGLASTFERRYSLNPTLNS